MPVIAEYRYHLFFKVQYQCIYMMLIHKNNYTLWSYLCLHRFSTARPNQLDRVGDSVDVNMYLITNSSLSLYHKVRKSYSQIHESSLSLKKGPCEPQLPSETGLREKKSDLVQPKKSNFKARRRARWIEPAWQIWLLQCPKSSTGTLAQLWDCTKFMAVSQCLSALRQREALFDNKTCCTGRRFLLQFSAVLLRRLRVDSWLDTRGFFSLFVFLCEVLLDLHKRLDMLELTLFLRAMSWKTVCVHLFFFDIFTPFRRSNWRLRQGSMRFGLVSHPKLLKWFLVLSPVSAVRTNNAQTNNGDVIPLKQNFWRLVPNCLPHRSALKGRPHAMRCPHHAREPTAGLALFDSLALVIEMCESVSHELFGFQKIGQSEFKASYRSLET